MKIKKLLGIGLLSGLSLCVFFTVVALAIPDSMMALFSKDKAVVDLGAGYLRIVGISFVITAAACGIAVFVNVFLNWVLIFGKFGLPAMGVNGAAVATCFSRFLEGFILVGFVYYRKYPVAAKFKEMLGFDALFFRKIQFIGDWFH